MSDTMSAKDVARNQMLMVFADLKDLKWSVEEKNDVDVFGAYQDLIDMVNQHARGLQQDDVVAVEGFCNMITDGINEVKSMLHK